MRKIILIPLVCLVQTAQAAPAFRTIQPSPVQPSLVEKIAQASIEQAAGANVVTLPWQPHRVYDIPIRQGMFTTFQFPTGESIKEFAVSSPDSVQLHVDGGASVAMLKLISPVSSVATVITNKRVYYMRIEPTQGAWYQGVSWSVPSGGIGAGSFAGIYTAPSSGASNAAVSGEDASAAPIYTGTPNFQYAVSGEASFRPVAVWDNGRFTWVQFKPGVQELPALFADGPNGLEIVNYTVHAHGTQLLVNRLMSKFILKLGKSEVVVTAQRDGGR